MKRVGAVAADKWTVNRLSNHKRHHHGMLFLDSGKIKQALM